MESKIGIVTICFNQARFLPEALRSVAAAGGGRIEYVIVDPGSTDGSRELIRANANMFSKIIFEPDRGPADGLNKGFAASRAEILGYLNADDRFLPYALDYVRRYFEAHPEVDLLLGAIRLIDEQGRPYLRRRTPDRLSLQGYAYETCNFWQQATFFRRHIFERVGGFNVDAKVGWDAELVIDMALAGARIGYTNVLLGDFRLHPESITCSGRFAEEHALFRQRIRDKILRAGVPPRTPLAAAVAKVAYKFNLRRHLSYLFATRYPGGS